MASMEELRDLLAELGQQSRDDAAATNYRFHRGETESLESGALAFLRLSLQRFAAQQRRLTEGESKPHSCSLRVPLSVGFCSGALS